LNLPSPNARLQRTRLRSPLSRKTLGVSEPNRVAVLCIVLIQVYLAACAGGGQQPCDDPVPAKLVNSVSPRFSDEFWKKHRDGFVKLVVLVERDGSVTFMRVESSGGRAYEQPVVEAVKQWRYTPATCAGKAVQMELTIDFKVTHEQAAS
jgi:TonB family protein